MIDKNSVDAVRVAKCNYSKSLLFLTGIFFVDCSLTNAYKVISGAIIIIPPGLPGYHAKRSLT